MAALAAIGMLVAAALTAAAQTGGRTVRIVTLGDSLTAGFDLPEAAAFPAKLAEALKAKGLDVAVANAGVSGDTASGGLARLDWSVPEGTDAVILALGANDALRGIDPNVTRAAVAAMVERLKARKIEVLLCGMLAPRNLGPDYARAFDAIFTDLGKDPDILFYPFFLDGVAMEPQFTLRDGLHPNAAGVAEIVRRIVPTVEELIARVDARRR